jgi:hypothetical protein
MIHFMHACGWWESTWISFTLVPLNWPQQESWIGRGDYLKALANTSTHVCDNAFSKLDFGYNPFGITLATPSDMMQVFESGIMPRVLKCFIASM